MMVRVVVKPVLLFGSAVWIPLVLAAGTPSTVSDEGTIWGFTKASSESQLEAEKKLAALVSPESARSHLAVLTSQPHLAGSPRNFELAEYVRDRWKEYGLQDVELVPYDVYLPYATETSVAMIEPTEFTASLREDPDPQVPGSDSVGLTFHGFSASVDTTAEVVYANSGNPEDYELLASQGIDVQGKIVLVRYSVPYSYRGFKALTAERRGAAGILIYSDPADDGFGKGKTYPDGPWGPESHIQRGAITYDFFIPGDPLTPGYASTKEAKRIPREDSPQIPTIASQPLSYPDARPILENLRGPEAPAEWQGGLPFTYHLGPGPAKVHMKVVSDDKIRTIWVVTGRIRGSDRPDELVILGNHRDAWVYGAVDPSSGTAAQLELARVLGQMARSGIRPRRTLIFANWDAEEFSLTGSTEWGEQWADQLKESAVAYLNVDSATSGPDLEASAVPALNRAVIEATRDMVDPATGESLLETWRAAQGSDKAEPVSGAQTATGAGLVGNRLGSGSDYTVFLNFLGVPIANLSFDGPYGVYHSLYDNFNWMERIGDPGFRYHAAMAELWGRLALRLANADVVPLDYAATADSLLEFLEEIEDQAQSHAIDLPGESARDAASRLQKAAARVNEIISHPETSELDKVNRALLQVERSFLSEDGIPGRPWFKHLMYAPKSTYAPEVLPGVAEAIRAGDAESARQQLRRLTETMNQAASVLESVSAE
jgi:N-acetylated-alpha-linked acidic dipeptidase